MSNVLNITSIEKLHQAFNLPQPQHPLISIINLADFDFPSHLLHTRIGVTFYHISLKMGPTEPFKYGNENVDFSEGALFGTAPNQEFEVFQKVNPGDEKGWILCFHPDLIKEYSLAAKMDNYGFFSYATNKALFLNAEEIKSLDSIITKLKKEYQTNPDIFSQDVLVANLELLFNYIKRYYSRQFLKDKLNHKNIVKDFNKLLSDYFNTEEKPEQDIPSVLYFAKQLNISTNHLSNLLKKDTGITAKDHIHNYIINRAKNLLLINHKSISEVAFELGFEYPQYFSRLFKNKTGKTPNQFRKSL